MCTYWLAAWSRWSDAGAEASAVGSEWGKGRNIPLKSCDFGYNYEPGDTQMIYSLLVSNFNISFTPKVLSSVQGPTPVLVIILWESERPGVFVHGGCVCVCSHQETPG